MRYLALDVGDERIGVAISDESGLLARPLETIRRLAGPSSYHRLARLIAEYAAQVIIVGWPLLPNGTEGAQTRSTEAYIRGLTRHVEIPIVRHDERDSSIRAAEILRENGAKSRRRAKGIDAVAAAVILEDYMNRRAEESSVG